MQRLILVAVTDAALMPEFAQAEAEALEAALAPGSGGGSWGLGLAGADALLVRRGPRRAGDGGVPRLLGDVRSRQALAFVDGHVDARPVEATQPFRHRDWLLGVAGADAIPQGFAAAAKARFPDHGAAGGHVPENAEAVVSVVMAALGGRNARDVQDLTTRAVRLGLGDAARALEGLLEAAGGLAGPGLVLGLMRPPHAFLVPVGRVGPLWYRTTQGTGQDPRPGRPPRHEHLRGVIAGAGAPLDARSVAVPVGSALELGLDCRPQAFPLA
jgi:hypothetical protein